MTALCFFHPSRVYKQGPFHVERTGHVLYSPTVLRKNYRSQHAMLNWG